jgi:hypothetical protein
MNAGEICDFCRHLWSTAGISAMTGFPITVKSSPARQCHRRTPRTSFNKRCRWTSTSRGFKNARLFTSLLTHDFIGF